MIKINYLNIIRKSWETTWKNKYLWWFGFFVALSGGGGINYFSGKDDTNHSREDQMMNWIINHYLLVIAIAIIFLVIFVLFFVLNIIGRGALISSIEKKIKGEPNNFRSGWKEGKKNFWKIFNLNVLLGLFLIFTLIILALPVFILILNRSYIIGGLLAFLAIIIFVPIAILTAYLRIYGYLYSVLGQLKFWASLENAYNLFMKNILSSIIMSLIFIPIGIVMILAILVIIPVLLLIFGLLSGGAYFLAGKVVAVVIGLIGLLIFLVYNLFVRSIFEVFTQAIWVNFFHEIAEPKITETVSEKIQEEPKTIAKPLPIIESKKEN
jgi:hypothetical protein